MELRKKTNRLLYINQIKMLNFANCSKCKNPMDYVQFLGEFNNRSYIEAVCNDCGEGMLVVFDFNEKTTKRGKRYDNKV